MAAWDSSFRSGAIISAFQLKPFSLEMETESLFSFLSIQDQLSMQACCAGRGKCNPAIETPPFPSHSAFHSPQRAKLQGYSLSTSYRLDFKHLFTPAGQK